MKQKAQKISMIFVCAIFILSTIGFVHHTCHSRGVSSISLLVDNSCDHCNEHKTGNHSQCHHSEHSCCEEHDYQAQNADDDDCCETTIVALDVSKITTNITNDLTDFVCDFVHIILTTENNFICKENQNETLFPPPLLLGQEHAIYRFSNLRL